LGVRVDQAKDATKSDSVEKGTGEQAESPLNLTANQHRLRSLAPGLIATGFKRDCAIDLRLAQPVCEAENESAGEDANEHSTYKQGTDHKAPCLVAGKAEKMASVVQKLVDGAALNQGGSALLRADEVDHQQEEEAAEQCPRE
jgi:hypothetical protein